MHTHTSMSRHRSGNVRMRTECALHGVRLGRLVVRSGLCPGLRSHAGARACARLRNPLIGHLGTRLFVGACEPVQNREPIRYLYIPDQNLFSPFFGLSSPGAARPSGLGFLAGRGRLWHVIGLAAQDGDVLGCAVRWGGGNVRRGGISGGLSGVGTAATGAVRDASTA